MVDDDNDDDGMVDDWGAHETWHASRAALTRTQDCVVVSHGLLVGAILLQQVLAFSYQQP